MLAGRQSAPDEATIGDMEALHGQRRCLRAPSCGRTIFLMTIIAINVPDDLVAALRVPPEQLGAELIFAAAARLYEEGRVSLAKAAEIAGIDRFTFAEQMAAKGIPTASFDAADVDVAAAAAR